MKLHNDICRCLGKGCESRIICRRYLTLSEDKEHDMKHGARLRSCVESMRDVAPYSDCIYIIPTESLDSIATQT